MPTPPAYCLLTRPWIPVLDPITGDRSKTGIAQALTRAHQLRLDLVGMEKIAALRLLAAVLDAAAGPRSTTEWDAAYLAPTLPTGRITHYLDTWSEHFDLLHPEQPFGQCAHLTHPNRTTHVLDPSSWGGMRREHFAHQLDEEAPALAPDKAALALLVLQLWHPGGIQTPHPSDPRASGGKLFGGRSGPLGLVTHLHVTAPTLTLKDQLLLALPPQPRAPGDLPAWERPCPLPAGPADAHGRPILERAATGRLDQLTWPTRRVRLITDDGQNITALALHDGDRTTDHPATVAHTLDPMTARTLTGGPLPLFKRGIPQPWAAALILDADTSPALTHVLAAAERGTLPADLHLTAQCSDTEHTNVYRAAISRTDLHNCPLGPAAALATHEGRTHLAAAARLIAPLQRLLDQHYKEAARLPPRQPLSDRTTITTSLPWHSFLADPRHDLSSWCDALRTAVLTTAERLRIAGRSAQHTQFLVRLEAAVERHLRSAQQRATLEPTACTPTVLE
ncbi:type I-E CRISPR-associated protein Cse1/CasA [Streptomyces albidoflavus]